MGVLTKGLFCSAETHRLLEDGKFLSRSWPLHSSRPSVRPAFRVRDEKSGDRWGTIYARNDESLDREANGHEAIPYFTKRGSNRGEYSSIDFQSIPMLLVSRGRGDRLVSPVYADQDSTHVHRVEDFGHMIRLNFEQSQVKPEHGCTTLSVAKVTRVRHLQGSSLIVAPGLHQRDA